MSFQGINPNSAAPAVPPGPSLAEIVRGLRARVGLILCTTAAVVALAVVVATLLPTRYTSSSVVMLDPRKNTIADLLPCSRRCDRSVLDPEPDPDSPSRDLAAEVIAKLDLYDDPEFNPALQQSVGGLLFSALNPRNWFADRDAAATMDPAVQKDAIIDDFSGHLWAESLGLSTTITVSFSSRDAKKAALIADTVAQTYVPRSGGSQAARPRMRRAPG